MVEWVHPSDKGGFTVRFMDGDEMDLGKSFNLRRYPPFKVETPDETIERLKGG